MPNPSEILRTILGGRGKAASGSYPEIAQFLKGDKSNAWIDTGPYHAYLRKGMPGRVDLANINRLDEAGMDNGHILPPDQRPPRGDFSGFMAELERAATEAGYDQVYVENIMNEFLPGVLERLGYAREPGGFPQTPSMTKRLR